MSQNNGKRDTENSSEEVADKEIIESETEGEHVNSVEEIPDEKIDNLGEINEASVN